MRNNIIEVNAIDGSVTPAAYQWDYGLVLHIIGATLPDVTEWQFSRGLETFTAIGDATTCPIPDACLEVSGIMRAYLVTHTGEDDGETARTFAIPVIERPKPSEVEPTPGQQDALDKAIALLQAATDPFAYTDDGEGNIVIGEGATGGETKPLQSIQFPGLVDKYMVGGGTADVSDILPVDTSTGYIPDGYPADVRDLKVGIVPKQSGTGDPSPENVRAISGWDSIKVTVTNGKQSTDPDYVSQEHTIPIGRTVYGGTLDVTTGELVVTWAMTTIGALSWSYDSQYTRFSCGIQGMLTGKYGTRQVPLYSSQYYNVKDGRPIGDVPNYAIYGSGSGAFVYITDSRYTDASAFKSANADVPIVYELATPQTYTLTPQQVTLLKGINNIFADAGTVEVKYSADIQGYIDKKIAEVQALVLDN